MGIESGDAVIIDYIGRKSDTTIFDTSLESVLDEPGAPARSSPPLSFTIGAERIVRGPGRIIEAIEEPLVGLEEGESGTVVIPPEQAYGETSDENVVTVARDELGRMKGDDVSVDEPREGLTVRTPDGRVGEIVSVDSTEIVVDFNHQLVGETLTFELTVRRID